MDPQYRKRQGSSRNSVSIWHQLNLSVTMPAQELGLMTQVQVLDLTGNPLREPFSRVLDVNGELAVVELCNRTSEKLDLTNCGFEVLPEEVWKG